MVGFFFKTLFIYLRERETVAFCMHPDLGLNLKPRYVPWPGMEPATFWCLGQCSNQLSHPARASLYSLILIVSQLLSFMILTVLKSTSQLFCNAFQNRLDSGFALLAGKLHTWYFSVHHIRRYMLSVGPNIGDVNFVTWGKLKWYLSGFPVENFDFHFK